MNKIFYVILFSLLSFFISSCISIEKRKYRDGYYIEWFTKNKTKGDSFERKLNETDSDSLIEIAENTSSQMRQIALDNNMVKNILIEKSKLKTAQIVFGNDTLPKKEKSNKKEIIDKNSGHYLAKKGFYFSLISVLLCLTYALIPVATVTSIIGIVYSIKGLHKIKRNNEKSGKGFAVAGIILNILFLILAISFTGMFIFLIFFLNQ